MLKEKIVHTLEQKNATILSFPERGPWGDSSYRGNCSGWIQAVNYPRLKSRACKKDSAMY